MGGYAATRWPPSPPGVDPGGGSRDVAPASPPGTAGNTRYWRPGAGAVAGAAKATATEGRRLLQASTWLARMAHRRRGSWPGRRRADRRARGGQPAVMCRERCSSRAGETTGSRTANGGRQSPVTMTMERYLRWRRLSTKCSASSSINSAGREDPGGSAPATWFCCAPTASTARSQTDKPPRSSRRTDLQETVDALLATALVNGGETNVSAVLAVGEIVRCPARRACILHVDSGVSMRALPATLCRSAAISSTARRRAPRTTASGKGMPILPPAVRACGSTPRSC